MNSQDNKSWIYYKLYLGSKADCADAVITDLYEKVVKDSGCSKWFYIRYMDEAGFHIRLRLEAASANVEALDKAIYPKIYDLIKGLHNYLPSIYQPMVSLPEYLDQPDYGKSAKVYIDKGTYEPEADKYGSGRGVSISEDIFQVSSELACMILSDEYKDLYSRKTILPILMNESCVNFPSVPFNEFWGQYSLYWLGGESTAADDWRAKFQVKADEITEAGHSILWPEEELPDEALAVINQWREALKSAALEYKKEEKNIVVRKDVLALNYAHLIMNRLGIATLEESYIATLLENALGVAA